MGLLLRLSLRNLLRQKRRNILLGSAMSLGVMILVVANSFSHGISDILFNRILRWVTGHVTVQFNEKSGITRAIFRDRERAFAAVQDEPGVERVDESIGVFMRAIGNGKADNVILVGVNTGADVDARTRREVEESFRLIEGSWKDLDIASAENPAIVSEEKARTLNVRRGDILRIRFRNVFGQDQAARLTVAGIMRNDNIFMQPVVFLKLSRTKELLGYRAWETGNLSLSLRHPEKDARAVADRVFSRLQPGLAAIPLTARAGGRARGAVLLGYRSDEESKAKLAGMLNILRGSREEALKRDGVIVSEALARELNLAPGALLSVGYPRKFEAKPTQASLKVTAVARLKDAPAEAVILMNDEKFYDLFYPNLPAPPASGAPGFTLKEDSPWRPLLSPEWILLPRTATTEEYQKKFKQLGQKKWKGTTVNVSTMYETASDILKLEGVLNLITLSAVLVLFFIIVLGVINTLRMTIRERTREIGTVRAIGMQKNDVRNMFVLETLSLTLISASVGIAAGFAVMGLLSRVTLHMKDNPMGMLLVDGHLHFVPTALGIIGNVLLIVAIAVVTAYFPARRAAEFSPAHALRQYE